MEITDLNSWWKTGEISDEYKKMQKRVLFNDIINHIEDRQVITITGLRRTGKTVLMHHLIDFLLSKKIKPQNVVYFNFDLFLSDIEGILKNIEQINQIDFRKEKIYLFLDEVQKIDRWQDKVKIIYDNYRNIKFFVSGSSSLFIEKRTKESLAGRSFNFQLLPLKFREYLELKDKKDWLKNPKLFKNEIKEETNYYLMNGGFPELMKERDRLKIKSYIKELIIDKVVYMDIPNAFEIEEPELLEKLISIISSNPGIISDYDNLASDLSRNRKTISNYLFYLEKSFIIKKIYNFSKNLLTSEKKKKRFYPATPALSFLFGGEYGRIIESCVLQNSDYKFFYRKNSKEVDFISLEGKVTTPIEVKTTNKIDKDMKISLLEFMKKFKAQYGIIITEDKEYEEEAEWFGVKGKIYHVPLWKWLLKDK